MRDVPRIARRQCGVFSVTQAYTDGWTTSALRHATRRGRLIRLRSGAYQLADLSDVDEYEQARWRHAGPAIGAVLTTPGALASHSTAAILRGLPLLFIPRRACVSVVPWHTGEIARVHVHRCTSAPLSMPVGDVGCLSVERTVIDLAREHGVAAGVIPLDFALHWGVTDVAKLYDALDRCYRWPGVRAAREAIALANPLSESVLESRSRLKFRQFGIPDPEPQVPIGNSWGKFLGRGDFYWDEFGVVGEADGDLKYDGIDPAPLLNEKIRHEDLADTGLEVVRWGSRDLRRFESVADRLNRAFRRGAQRAAADRRWTVLPRRERHFDPASVAEVLRW